MSHYPKCTIQGDRFLSLDEVQTRTLLGSNQIFRAAMNGKFPYPRILMSRELVWVESEIDGWIHESEVWDLGAMKASRRPKRAANKAPARETAA